MTRQVTVTINGQTYTLTESQGQPGTFTATIQAPSNTSGSHNSGQGPGVGSAAQGKGYYPVSVTAEDAAGNTTTVNDQTAGEIGTACRLMVEETVLPTATVTYPTQGAYITTAQPTITASFYDAGSGINNNACYVQIDGGSWISMPTSGAASASTHTGSYTPSSALSEGVHTVQVKTTDHDGNTGSSTTVTFTIDTIPPTLNVTSPTEGATLASTSVTVSGTTNDATSSPVTVTISVNGGSPISATVSGGTFSQAVSCSEGANTLVITATDAAGKYTTVTRHITVKISGPQITNITIVDNPTETGTDYVITVTVTDI